MNISNKSSGQVMLLAILAIGGAMLGAATIAGLVMLYQVRQSTDLANSAKAVFAADAGIECGLYEHFHATGTCSSVSFQKAYYTITCRDGSNAIIDCTNPTARTIKSLGTAQTAKRAFLLYISQ